MSKPNPRIELVNGRWIGYDDKGLHVTDSYDQTRTVKMLAKRGFMNVPIVGGPDVANEEEVDTSPWPVERRFGFLRQLVGMLAKSNASSLIVLGPGGLGKTHTVLSSLRENGFMEASEATTYEGLTSKTFKQIKGYSTAKAMYRQLYENKDGLLIFDDCDEVVKDATALQILKGALDSYDKRVISWLSERETDLPESFEFTGRVIFISNLKRSQIQNALATRAYVVDLKMTLEQKLERMQQMTNDPNFLPGYSDEHKAESMALITRVAPRAKEVSLRTLQAVVKIRAMDCPGWEDLAEYALTN